MSCFTLTHLQAQQTISYCTPTYNYDCEFGSEINDFVLSGENGTIINDLATGCSGGYDDRTTSGDTITLAQGGYYVAKISTDAENNDVALWIDFDNNGTFDETEKIGEGALIDGSLVDIQLSIPESATEGIHRMRARCF